LTRRLPTRGLQLFAVLTFFWLAREIAWWRHHPPPRLLEWGGGWSYSIYLMHVAAPAAFDLVRRCLGQPEMNPLLRTLGFQCTLFVVCYVFNLLVEAPSLRLARRVGSCAFQSRRGLAGALALSAETSVVRRRT